MGHAMPIAFILAATDAGPMILNRFDVCAHEQGYFGVGASLLATGRFDQQDIDGLSGVLQLRRQHHGDGVVALDIGANIGTHTLAWAKLMKGWGEVIAVEAQERVYYALAGNICINNLFNAEAICAVAGETTGLMEIPELDHEKPASFGSLELVKCTEEEIGQTPTKTRRVAMLKIDNIVREHRVDLIKLDIEGMELGALEGARRTIERCQPALFIEWVKCGEAPLRDFLAGYDYEIHMLGPNLLAVHIADPIRDHIVLHAGQKETPPGGSLGA
jgi:FkbM family methyltransferase